MKQLTFKETLAEQLYLSKICFGTAPFYMLYHIFESVKLQVSIFFEFTWTINYCLEVAEKGESWTKILWSMAILLIAIAISTVTFSLYNQYVSPRLKPMLYKSFRLKIYEKTKDIDLSQYDNVEFYQKFILSTNEADNCIDRYLDSIDQYSASMIGFLLSLSFGLFINPIALIIPVFSLPLDIIFAIQENKKTIESRMARVTYEQKREYQNRVFYLIDYAKDLRLNHEMKKKCSIDFSSSNKKIEEINTSYGKQLFLLNFSHHTIVNLLLDGLLWTLLLYQVLVLHNLSFAHMITSRNCGRRTSWNASKIVLNWKSIVENSTYLKSIRELMNTESTVISKKNEHLPEGDSTVSINHVDFSYILECPVLKNINIKLNPGQKIALVGYNGSGKTTLVKLLLRLYDPTNGTITYNDKNIKDINVEEYRHSIGAVFQDFKIYAATIKENVLMDIPANSKEEDYKVEQSLYDARFPLTDHRLTYQIETPLTTEFEKDGVNLSGGEQQKVAIARTLYKKQNLIIMDEPSSALDPLSEYKLNHALNEIAKDKTVIYISHRLSTTRDADHIYMMEKGQIIEEGTHKELLKLNKKYAQMWNIQAGRYLTN